MPSQRYELHRPLSWTWRHGPAVRAPIVAAANYQDELRALRPLATSGWLPLGLLPEPDNTQDRHAVAVIGAGLRVGYLRRDYARLWHPVVRAEHAAGRRVVGEASIRDGKRGVRLSGKFIQPAPVSHRTPAAGPRVPCGGERIADYWPIRGERVHVATYPAIDTIPMTRVEHLLYDQLMQCPEPFFFHPQYPLGWLRLDFFCAYARLCVEVDGPEHWAPEREEQDARRDYVVAKYGIVTFRLANEEVEEDPKRAAQAVFEQACKRVRTHVHTDRRSPYFGWRPADMLRPQRG